MKRKDLVKLLEDEGLKYVRPGGDHDLYGKPGLGRLVPVPRHREIPKFTAALILKEAGIIKR